MNFDSRKFDELCARVREEAKASAVLLIVVGGPQGSGYSVQSVEPLQHGTGFATALPRLLREMADEMEGKNDRPTTGHTH